MAGNYARRRGFGYERELVNTLKQVGINAKRAYGSNGQAMGEHEEVDLVIPHEYTVYELSDLSKEDLTVNPIEKVDKLKAQCKRKASLPKYLGLTEHVDLAIFREDRGETKVLMRLSTLIDLLLK